MERSFSSFLLWFPFCQSFAFKGATFRVLFPKGFGSGFGLGFYEPG